MNSNIHPSAVIDPEARLGRDVVVGPFCVIDKGVQIGDGCVLDAHVSIGKNVRLGKRNRLFPNCVIGQPPQVLGFDADTPIGGLEIGDGNIIREFVTIHPSMHAGENTKIGNGNLLMIGVHLGHDCQLADKIVISNYTQISGHCHIETGAWLSGMVAVHQFCTIGKWCYAAGYTGINHDIPPFVIVSGHYPPQIRALNKRGLGRAGLNDEQQKKLAEAFRFIWRGDGPILPRVNELANRNGIDENVKAVVDSLLNSSRQRFGRYLELFR